MKIQLRRLMYINVLSIKKAGFIIPIITSTIVTTDRIIKTVQILLIAELSLCEVECAIVYTSKKLNQIEKGKYEYPN